MRKRPHDCAKVLIAAFGLFSSACATISGDGRKQLVKIESDPQGASVLWNGKEVGRTPLFLEATRAKTRDANRIELESADGPIELRLESKYRFKDSLFSNLIFLNWAPAGWIADLVSGAAWQFTDPQRVKLKLSVEDAKARQDPEVTASAAIAPPVAASLALSDAGAKLLERELSLQIASGKLRSFRETLPQFLAHGADFDTRTSLLEKRRLARELGLKSVYESTIELQNQRFVLSAKEVDLFSGTEGPERKIEFEATSEIQRSYFFGKLTSRLLPNTVGVGLLEEKIQVTQNGQTYALANAGNEEWWATGLRYLNAIDLTNLPERREGRSARVLFSLVPSFRVSRRHVRLGDLPGAEPTTEFIRWWVSAGYGPEVGLQISRHYLYVQLIPILYWNELSWREGGRDHTRTGTGVVAAQSEIGYVLNFNPRWNLRVFTRAHAEDPDGWAEAFGNRLPPAADRSVTTNIAGLSIGYNLRPTFQDVKAKVGRR